MSSNMSTGQIVGYVAGAALAYFTGGASLTYMAIGGAIGAALDPPKGPTIEGPRLNDLAYQTSTYGAVIPRIYGTIATTGNVFWMEGNKLKEVVKKKKSGGKGGGGSSTTKTYTYYATFAVSLADTKSTGQPIAGVRRIWIGSNLIYDAGSDDVETIIASNQAATGFKVYLGTEDQQPDPRMQADVGVANCPAYRGRAYIVFYDLALAEYGNTITGAQVKVEVVARGESSGFRIIATHDVPNAYAPAAVLTRAFRADGNLIYYGYPMNDVRTGLGGLSVRAWDAASNSVLRLNDEQSVAGAYWGIGAGKSDNYKYLFGGKGYRPSFIEDRKSAVFSVSYDGVTDYYEIYDGKYYCQSFLSSTMYLSAYAVGSTISKIADFSIPVGISSSTNGWGCCVTDGFVYFGVVGSVSPFPPAVLRYRRDTMELDAVAWVPTDIRGFSVISDDEIYYATSGTGLYRTNDFFASSVLLGTNIRFSHAGRKDYAWTIFKLSPDVLALAADVAGYGMRITVFQSSQSINEEKEYLSEIISSEIAQSALIDIADLDTSLLTAEVRGFRVTNQAAIKSIFDPLQAAFPFDVIQSGYKLKCIPRGRTPVATIPAADLGAHAAGEEAAAELVVSREMDTQLPRQVSIKYLDLDREYDQAEESAERNTTDAVDVQSAEIAMVMTADEAANAAEVLLSNYWMGRREAQFHLPPIWRALEPGDVVTVQGPNFAYELLLRELESKSNGVIDVTAVFHAAPTYTGKGKGGTPAAGGVVPLKGPSLYVLIDGPTLTADTNEPGMLAAMCGYTSGWDGGTILRSVDGGQTWAEIQSFAGAVPIGYARTALASALSTQVDFAAALQVDLVAGELESVTQLQMLNGANYFAYGAAGRWEIIAAQNCVQQGDGSWLLTTLLRGRFGTEWAAGQHAVGDTVVYLPDADLVFVGLPSALLNAPADYRGISNGRSIDTDTTRSATYTGANLKPLAGVNPGGSRDAAGNWTITWNRRTRINGELANYVDVPVGESTESYEIEIYTSSAYTTLKRTLTASTPSVAYSAALQVTDFGSNQATLYVRIYQLSAAVGRGYVLQATLTR